MKRKDSFFFHNKAKKAKDASSWYPFVDIRYQALAKVKKEGKREGKEEGNERRKVGI